LAVEKRRRLQLFVIGSAADHCTEEARRLGCEVGAEAAKCGVTGGLGGVMEAA
jgi:predicted Rossmann-fold nucleotide-binding protein